MSTTREREQAIIAGFDSVEEMLRDEIERLKCWLGNICVDLCDCLGPEDTATSDPETHKPACLYRLQVLGDGEPVCDLKAKLAEAAKEPLYKAFCEMEAQRDLAWRLLWRLRRADVSSQWGCWCSTDNGPHTPECIDASSIFINLPDKEREQL